MEKLEIDGIPVRYEGGEEWQKFYFSLLDLCRGFEGEAKDHISNWLRARSTLNFMVEWERKYNPDFRVAEFDNLMRTAISLQLHVLANLENLNQFLIKHGLDQEERFQVLRNEAEHQCDFLAKYVDCQK